MHDVPLITTVAAAFTAAWFFGLITQRLRLSPIVGYLLGGVAIGPHTPGFVGDARLAGQLAELGVVLLMFGVGLHFHLGDLLKVRRVAVPGALGQSAVTTVVGCGVALALGWSLKGGVVFGLAVAVASTVVLIRVLSDHHLLDTEAGHVAVGWLVVEDLLTVVVLVLVPTLAGGGGDGAGSAWRTLLVAVAKLAALVALMLLGGSRVIPWVMVRVARLRSRELFTLTVLVVAVAVAVGSAYAFGASMALGAFLAGMVVAQSPVSQQAAADALPLRDAFAVLFFASVGMAFDPGFVARHPGAVVAGLAVVMLVKPAAALALVAALGYPPTTAVVVALGLAQVGEFSFILAELGRSHGLLGGAGHDLIVTCALASITLNPVLMRSRGRVEWLLRRWPAAWRFMNRHAAGREREMNERVGATLAAADGPVAVILGYGPVGRAVDGALRATGLETVVVDLNVDTVEALTRAGRRAVYGDAFNVEVMHRALARATHLVIALPHATNRAPLIVAAKLINPAMRVFVRARYVAERDELLRLGADGACFEEAEAAAALTRLVLADRGVSGDREARELRRVRRDLLRPPRRPGE